MGAVAQPNELIGEKSAQKLAIAEELAVLQRIMHFYLLETFSLLRRPREIQSLPPYIVSCKADKTMPQ